MILLEKGEKEGQKETGRERSKKGGGLEKDKLRKRREGME